MAKTKIDIAPQEKDQIEIRGMTFDVLRSDQAIIDKALSLQEQIGELGVNDYPALIAFIRDIMNFVDEMLGVGALEKIAGVDDRKNIDFTYACSLFQQIALPVLNMKTERVTKQIETKYEDAPSPEGEGDADIPAV